MRAAQLLLASLGLSSLVTCSRATTPRASAPAPEPRPPEPAFISASAVDATIEPFGELDVPPGSFDFKGHPEVAGRIAESPHAYFRFTQRLFAKATCKRLDALVASSPKARLHGDAHIEQYFVSDLGRGLSDFDDAAVGPPLVDLTRFAASTLIAARLQGLDSAREGELLDQLFAGYRAGLAGKTLAKEAPPFAVALSKKFTSDKKGFLLYLDNQLEPIDAEETSFVKSELGSYVGLAAKDEPKRPAEFFDVKRLGRTKIGIGSALTRKYVVVLEGSSKAEEDDVVVEIKQVSDLSEVPCVKAIPAGAADARAAMQKAAGDKKLLRPALLPNGKFWVNEWLTNYEEARIRKLMPADLRDLVFEAGVTLAGVHRSPLPDGPAPSATSLSPSAELEQSVRDVAKQLVSETMDGWERFHREVKGT